MMTYQVNMVIFQSYVYTIWLFNIAMENGPFIDGLPNLKMVIFHGYVYIISYVRSPEATWHSTVAQRTTDFSKDHPAIATHCQNWSISPQQELRFDN